MADLFPTFRGTKEGQSVLLALAFSQITLIKNNQYAKVVYLGVAYSALLHKYGVGPRCCIANISQGALGCCRSKAVTARSVS